MSICSKAITAVALLLASVSMAGAQEAAQPPAAEARSSSPSPSPSSPQPRAIRRIAVLDVVEPDKYILPDTNKGTAVMRALVGPLAALDIAARTARLNDEHARRDVKLGMAINAALDQALKNRGIDAVRIPGAQPTPGTKGTPPDYSAIPTDADVILRVRLAFAGFLAGYNQMSGYRPMVHAWVILWPKEAKQALMFNHLAYCSHLGTGNFVELPCSQAVQALAPQDSPFSEADPTGYSLLVESAQPIAEEIAREVEAKLAEQ